MHDGSIYYRPQTKLREGNVFTPICGCWRGGRGWVACAVKGVCVAKGPCTPPLPCMPPCQACPLPYTPSSLPCMYCAKTAEFLVAYLVRYVLLASCPMSNLPRFTGPGFPTRGSMGWSCTPHPSPF